MKTKLIIIIGFVLAFSAGIVVGVLRQRQMAVAQPATTQPATRPAEGSWLAGELKLDPEQAKKVRKIWDNAMRSAGDPEDRMRDLRRERERKITALLRVEDIPQYDMILQEYNDKVSQFWRDHRKRIDQAEDETMTVLSDEQRAKFEQLRKRHGRGPGPRGGRDKDKDRGDRERDDGDREKDRDRDKDRGNEKARGDRPPTRPAP